MKQYRLPVTMYQPSEETEYKYLAEVPLLPGCRAWGNTPAEALGDYISAKDVHNKASIKYTSLRNWRNSGKIRAKKVGGTWFYSRENLLGLIKTSEG